MENLKKFCKEKSITFFFPIALVLTIVPLIVRLKLLDVDSETIALFGEAKTNSDLFSQNKAIALMFFSVVLLIISAACFKHIFKKKDKIVNSIVILAFVFLILSLLSSIFSSYRSIAFWGIFDRAEGFVTIACYILLFIYSIYAFKTSSDYKFVIIPIIIIVCLNAFIGLFQYTNHDLLKTGLGALFSNVDPDKMTSTHESGTLYGTLYHYNYVGSFAALVIPILILAFFFMDDIILKLSILFASVCGFWLLFGSTSRAGIIGLCASILFAIFIFAKQIKKNIKPLAITLCAILVLTVGANFATGNKLFRRIPTLVSDGLSIFKDTSDFDYTEHTPIKNAIQKGKDMEIVLQNNDSLTLSYSNNTFTFTNAAGENINYDMKQETDRRLRTYTTTDERYSSLSFKFGSLVSKTRYDALMLNINNQTSLKFMLKEDNTLYMVYGYDNKPTEIVFPETIGFNGKEKIASARGYIWSRSLPLLKDCLILGKGPDTFAFDFPQNDVIGKLYAYDTTNEIVDKPHDLYLQTAISNGILALIIFIAIFIIYIVDSLKLYAFKATHNEKELMGIANFLAIIGYLGAGIFNDSVISVAPVFWIVLGVGVAINYSNRQELNK